MLLGELKSKLNNEGKV